MRTAYSLLLREYLSSNELDYPDTTSFQTVCPNCLEPVFLVRRTTREGAERTYLSHYRARSDEARACELRVQRLERETDITAANAAARGQLLERFQAVFREELLAARVPDPGHRADIARRIDRLWRVEAWRSFLRAHQRNVTPMLDRIEPSLAQSVREHYPDQSPLWHRVRYAYTRDFLRHLHTPRALPTFSFAAGFASLHIARVARRAGCDPQTRELLPMLEDLLTGNRSTIQRRCRELWERRLLAPVSAILLQGTANTLMEMPWLDILHRRLDAHPAAASAHFHLG